MSYVNLNTRSKTSLRSFVLRRNSQSFSPKLHNSTSREVFPLGYNLAIDRPGKTHSLTSGQAIELNIPE